MMEKFIQHSPNRYVYHISTQINRESIKRKGLLPMQFEDSEWRNSPGLYYPKGIFVNNTDDYTNWFYFDEGLWIPINFSVYDLWVIDTKHLRNKWFIDENRIKDGTSLFTTSAIPASHLKLTTFKNGTCFYCNTLIEGFSLNQCLTNEVMANQVEMQPLWLHLNCHKYFGTECPDDGIEKLMDKKQSRNKIRQLSLRIKNENYKADNNCQITFIY